VALMAAVRGADGGCMVGMEAVRGADVGCMVGMEAVLGPDVGCMVGMEAVRGADGHSPRWRWRLSVVLMDALLGGDGVLIQ